MPRSRARLLATPPAPATLGLLLLALSGEALAQRFALCGPGFTLPPIPEIEAPTTIPGAVDIEGDDADLSEAGVSIVRGDVQLRREGRHVSADEVRYVRETDTAYALGNLKVWGEDVYLTGTRGEMNMVDDVTTVEQAAYRALAAHAHGTAERLTLSGSEIVRATDASYTTCNPDDVVWVLEADRIKLDKIEDQGIGHHVWVKFKRIPIFYSPYLSFPLSDARKSGFLAPSFGVSETRGVEARVPYYFNLAPNFDATLAARVMSDRGAQVQGEFRYLFPWGQGDLTAEVMPEDTVREESRLALAYRHQGYFAPRWYANVYYDWVSDQEYFDDLGTSLTITGQTFMEQRADVVYSGDRYYVLGRVQNYQTLDRTLIAAARPYKRLPQLWLETLFLERNLRPTFNLRAELVNFERRSSVTGVRLDLRPNVTIPYRTAAGFVVPRATLRYTAYALEDRPTGLSDDPSRVIPSFSLDSGLFFERRMRLGSRSLVQTLEPRVFYLVTPFDDQDDLPVFDTGEYTFSFAQLFREDRFSGGDRVGDAHQATLALTTRFLDERSGAELVRASVGQIRYFRDREVTLFGLPKRTARSSDIVAEVTANLDERWRLSAGLQWDPRERRTNRSTVAARYSPDARRVVNVAYRFLRDTLEQTDASFAWPVARHWRAVGRWNYSVDGRTTLEAFAGLEYEDCCWGVRVVARRFLNALGGEHNTGIFAQLVLKGLADFGDAEEILERSIPGYRNEF